MNKKEDEKIKLGIITEVGDLGLGYEELDEKDQEKLKQANKDKKK